VPDFFHNLVSHREMRTEQTKGVDELATFERFVDQSRLAIDVASIEKKNPPHPDILCRHQTEGLLAFELVELCDPNIARAVATLYEGYMRTSDPSASIISKKLRRKYQTTAPIELLCYTAGRIYTPDNIILPTIEPYLSSWRHTFRRAWLLGRKGVYKIWEAGE
jgi:hypothetical protein